MKRTLPVTLLLFAGACGDDAGSGGAPSTGTTTSSSSSSGATSTSTGGGGGGGAPATVPYVYVGTSADKIFVLLLDRETGALSPVGESDAGSNPSFLASDPEHRYLYAVNEGSSEVAAFSIDSATGELTFLNRVGSQGSGPAHVSVDASGSFVLAANYGSGHVASFGIGADGSLDDGLVSVQYAGENAHLIRHDAYNGVAYVPCLGSDYVNVFDLDPASGVLAALGGAELNLPAGSGPRHLELHPTLPIAYVINETGDSVVVAERTPNGPLLELQTVPTLPGGADPAANFCSDIHATPDGKWLYGANRGHDSLAIYAIDPSSGLLTPVGHQPVGGEWPRNFSIDPQGEIVLVANQQSDEIVSFRIDPATGLLTELATTPTEGGPAFVGVFEQALP